ncbi:hypothetical protein M758_7G169400 [Ceratodon purpureus]|uniref:Secreted protein n=1 Tax=Ceratodon purpureus TaxID=3225 RepID=A0A8T0HFZ3_CERPU|nr:hypothetical protein KC19_7G172200 [Ceratodon purpureus]KAG0611843.1 hypothetical protein M758_7G169400 [Ceratodon purpureus]
MLGRSIAAGLQPLFLCCRGLLWLQWVAGSPSSSSSGDLLGIVDRIHLQRCRCSRSRRYRAPPSLDPHHVGRAPLTRSPRCLIRRTGLPRAACRWRSSDAEGASSPPQQVDCRC